MFTSSQCQAVERKLLDFRTSIYQKVWVEQIIWNIEIYEMV